MGKRQLKESAYPPTLNVRSIAERAQRPAGCPRRPTSSLEWVGHDGLRSRVDRMAGRPPKMVRIVAGFGERLRDAA
jgi:hypothetical protein